MFVLLGVVEDDGSHADGAGSLGVFGAVVGEDAFFGLELKLLAEAEVDGGLGLDQVLVGRDDGAVEQPEDGVVLGHRLAHLVAPVGEAVEAVALGLEAGEQGAHAGHFAGDDLGVVLHEGAELGLERGVALDEPRYDLLEGDELAVEGLDDLGVVEQRQEDLQAVGVGDVAAEELVEVVVNEDFAEVEDEGGEHGGRRILGF